MYIRVYICRRQNAIKMLCESFLGRYFYLILFLQLNRIINWFFILCAIGVICDSLTSYYLCHITPITITLQYHQFYFQRLFFSNSILKFKSCQFISYPDITSHFIAKFIYWISSHNIFGICLGVSAQIRKWASVPVLWDALTPTALNEAVIGEKRKDNLK